MEWPKASANGPTPYAMYSTSTVILGIHAGVYLLREALNVVRRYLVEWTCKRLSRDTIVELVARTMRQDLGRFSQDRVGATHGRIFRSVDGFVRFISLSFLDFFPALFTGVIALLAATTKHPLPGPVMVGVIPAAVFLTVRQSISQKGIRIALMRDSEQIDGAIVEQLNGIEYVRAADTRHDELRRLDEATEPQLLRGMPVVEVDNLVVEYVAPCGASVRALDGVSLEIFHGETIGVAGRSGCGKSTWLKVLLRLTHPCEGDVTIGGARLDEVSREAIGRPISYVGQTPFLFSGTIADNIAYGNEGATREQVEHAARFAAIHDEILAMSGGYDSPVAERGQNLSGGQRQRIAIARVLLKRPPVPILDEATSALDNISEREVQRALGVRDPDRTTILVAHRLSTLRHADRIFVFDGGRIVEAGPYDELLERGGAFAELVQSAECEIEAECAAV